MMRIRTAAIWVAFAGAFRCPRPGRGAQTAPQGLRTAQASQPAATDASAQRRSGAADAPAGLSRYYEWRTRGVYPRYYPGRNAVRECNATYVQEYRPSGTVIVPRMSCFWRPG